MLGSSAVRPIDPMIADIEKCDHMMAKIRSTSRIYSQKLYAALCNNDFIRVDPFDILKGAVVSGPSWRGAGSILARLRGEGDYTDWFLSGSCDGDHVEIDGHVSEGVVTPEIRADLLSIGWIVAPDTI